MRKEAPLAGDEKASDGWVLFLGCTSNTSNRVSCHAMHRWRENNGGRQVSVEMKSHGLASVCFCWMWYFLRSVVNDLWSIDYLYPITNVIPLTSSPIVNTIVFRQEVPQKTKWLLEKVLQARPEHDMDTQTKWPSQSCDKYDSFTSVFQSQIRFCLGKKYRTRQKTFRKRCFKARPVHRMGTE